MKKYHMIYDGDSFIDGIDFDDFDRAKETAIDILINWQVEEINNHPIHLKDWSENDIEDWDYMIDSCNVWIDYINDDGDEVRYFVSDEELKEIGWVYYDELMEIEK